MELFIFLVFWALLAWAVSGLAQSRGRSGIGFFLVSFFFSPVLGLIIVLVMSNLTEEEAKQASRRREDEAKEERRKNAHERQLESIKAIAATPIKSAVKSRDIEPISIADEIRKLGALRTEGLLTDAEFQNQKSLLLGSPTGAITTTIADSKQPVESTAQKGQEVHRMGICPNCTSNIPLASEVCSICKANFGTGSAWSVQAI